MSSREVPLDEFATDFGGLRRAVPKVVHRMPSAFPSVLLSSGRQLTLRGAGHSCDGQTVTDGELLVTYAPKTAAAQVRDLGEGLIEVPAGMSWHGLERYLNRRSRAVPVLPNYLHMSVGGTLSVGGAGIDSVRYGMQVDHVERIQLIDGTGASRWCSRTDHPELFRFALGGLGTAGLIERAVLRTVPYHRYTHVHRAHHATLTELAGHTERIAQRDDVDIYWALLRRGRLVSTTGWRGSDVGRCDDENCAIVPNLPSVEHDDITETAFAVGDRVRMWTDYVVPAGQLAPMLATVEALLSRYPLNRVLMMLYILIVRRPPDATSFAFTPVRTDPVSIGLGVYTTVDHDPAATAATRDVFHELLERCCELGGRPYLYGANDLDDAMTERLYGADLDHLAQLRSSHRLEHVNAHLPLVSATRRTPSHNGRW
ncbi:FAD-binding protein [Nocardia amamiensis]|uniref:FAD-binding protein n=1 Tax=Nocardia amamiensis TaxID=404578 RepID=A0ABS0CUG4_9NOCA|nr:FAD-binding protein [Nocardia amamiensis]MBF6300249.1 FAD-binding protein [Nocardia amamiensis]